MPSHTVPCRYKVVEKFIFVYVIDDLGGTQSLCGYSVAVTVVFELPIFHYGERLMRALGHEAMILLSLLSYAVRTFGYSRLQPHTVWCAPRHSGLGRAREGTGWVPRLGTEVGTVSTAGGTAQGHATSEGVLACMPYW